MFLADISTCLMVDISSEAHCVEGLEVASCKLINHEHVSKFNGVASKQGRLA